jgi:formamidopyrimidine-DNA glycosylase
LFEDVRKFGRIYLYNDLSIINSTHGPEPLGINFTLQLFKKMLSQRKRNIKALLLDQSFLSGLGNIYVDESLWKSGIHPNSLANSIPQKRIEALHSNIISTLKEAIDKKGTTIIDFSVNGESGKYANSLKIYGRTEKSCLNCGYTIKKLKIAGRGTYVCFKCQKKYTKE